MRIGSTFGKFAQLSQLRLGLWPRFCLDWLKRKKSGTVPCVFPMSQMIVRVPLGDFYESYSFFCESKQGKHEIAFFLGRLRPQDVIYDIGAFRGAYGVAAKAVLGDATTVHLFEPLPDNARAIETILTLNRFTTFQIVQKAVGGGDSIHGVLNESALMLRKGDTTEGGPLAEFPATSLDHYAEETKTVPSVIKIDVEGFELEVLQGGQKLLEESKPRLWLELHPNFLVAQGHSWEEAVDYLKSLGYSTISFFDDFSVPTRDLSFHLWCEG